ncbi:DUF3421 domain-containing protein [filamentous cyanobacterium LEGE 11480]|uniref:DUF3421 domain-containing protein n=1 Tax=Romeriopsis navalis LEGE 11480 TaxID=2777977 RepID=A0A928Z372_9CYAN|nr:DUF3421 domain-containing protein [Romeriopsis navalis]MBE9029762.1 DUF3421 domain-containing protein [Romeriopsis navalis LEGE 11480]
MFRQIASISALALATAPMVALNSSMASAAPTIQARSIKQQTKVNGRNVNYIRHSKQGYYINHGKGIWYEGNAGNPTEFKFQEVQRDEWSVYLLDRSRNVRIQLDLHRKKVIYSARGQRSDLYNITSAQSKKMINAGNVNYVRHSRGAYVNRGNNKWVSTDRRNQVERNFEEVQRDEWSVYLLDRSRNIQVQLDLYRKRVSYKMRGRKSDRYRITNVSTRTPRITTARKRLTWVNARNGEVPRRAVMGGRETGRRLYICRANYNGGVHPGKIVANNCNISYAGKEIEMPKYQALVNLKRLPLTWKNASNGSIPRKAVMGGRETGRRLFVCRARYKGGVHPGKLVARNCNIGYAGQEIEVPRYQVLVRR